jgi:hypothetical protein
MTPHPSLTAKPIKIDPIHPVETMAPYDLCWCRSGKKYKWCHFRREKQNPVNVFAVESDFIAAFRAGYCSHPDPIASPCSTTITKAHTVQRNGGMAAIAEDGHVFTVKPSMKDMIASDGNPSPRKIGVGNASVFPGFCSKHDSELFKPVEGKSIKLDQDTAFLFSYRAIAYERFSKESQLKGIDAQRDMDKGHSFFHQALIQKHLNIVIAGIEVGRKDMAAWTKQFDDRLLSGKRGDFHFLSVKFDCVLPIVACGAFHPEFDLQGTALQKLGTSDVDFEHVTLTVTAFEGHTIAVFGWVGNENGAASSLSQSFKDVSDDRKADALLRLLFVHTDNLFLRMSWWSALSEQQQIYLKQLIKSGTSMKIRSGEELADEAKALVIANAIEQISA